jgi:hypothetical protein
VENTDLLDPLSEHEKLEIARFIIELNPLREPGELMREINLEPEFAKKVVDVATTNQL